MYVGLRASLFLYPRSAFWPSSEPKVVPKSNPEGSSGAGNGIAVINSGFGNLGPTDAPHFGTPSVAIRVSGDLAGHLLHGLHELLPLTPKTPSVAYAPTPARTFPVRASVNATIIKPGSHVWEQGAATIHG